MAIAQCHTARRQSWALNTCDLTWARSLNLIVQLDHWYHEISLLLHDGRNSPQHLFSFPTHPRGWLPLFLLFANEDQGIRMSSKLPLGVTLPVSGWPRFQNDTRWIQNPWPPCLSQVLLLFPLLASCAWNRAQLDHGCHFTHTSCGYRIVSPTRG